MAGEEAEQLRDDIEIVRVMIDAALDHGLDHRLLDACASVLRDRQERLEALELAGGSRGEGRSPVTRFGLLKN